MNTTQRAVTSALNAGLTSKAVPILAILYRELSVPIVSAAIAYFVAAYSISTCIYRLWFHPLARIPGPKLYTLSDIPFYYVNSIQGQGGRLALKLHQRYGPLVRVGPSHVIVDGVVGWAKIHGNRKNDFPKRTLQLPDIPFSLFTAPKEPHRRMRRQLAPAFSDAALLKQEMIIMQYIELLLTRLADRKGGEINVVQWFNFTTFDIFGELAFSSSYGSLANNGYHPWVMSIFKGLRAVSFLRFLARLPLGLALALSLQRIVLLCNSKMNLTDMSLEKPKKRLALARSEVEGEMDADTDMQRQDYIYYMLKKGRDGISGGMSEREILASSPALVLAGSETTATALSGLFFYLKKTPRSYQRLVEEVRSSFACEDEITIISTQKLDYLQACINECLRIYPPAAETPPRICQQGETIHGQYIPPQVILTIFQYATHHNPENFLDPGLFVPERWLPAAHPMYEQRFVDDHREAYKPFSYGTRDCLGKNLALAEIRLIVSKLLFRFDYSLVPGQEDWHEKQKMFLVWDKGPLMITLQPREKNSDL